MKEEQKEKEEIVDKRGMTWGRKNIKKINGNESWKTFFFFFFFFFFLSMTWDEGVVYSLFIFIPLCIMCNNWNQIVP